jgi:hypothetical protein
MPDFRDFREVFEDANDFRALDEEALVGGVKLEEILARVSELIAADGRSGSADYRELGQRDERWRLPDAPTREHFEKGPACIRAILGAA